MKIEEIKIKNFRGYGENSDVEDGFYSFNQLNTCRFIIFNGYNGFGKTSFFEAVEWCLTNSVERLSSFEDNDSVTNLRGNHYLSFISKDDSQRNAEVIIVFDNKIIIKRTTTSKSLHANDYNDNTHFFLNGNEVAVDLDNIEGFSLRKIYAVNFLGQETILDLLRKDKPEKRSSKFLGLIDLNILNKIQTNSNPRNFNYNSKIEKAKEEIININKDRDKANELLIKIGAESVETYMASIELKRVSFVTIINTLAVPEIQSLFQPCIEMKDLTLENCLDLVDIINNRSIRIKDQFAELTQKKRSKEDYDNITSAIALFTRINKSNSIKDVNFDKLTKAYNINLSRCESIKLKTAAISEISLRLSNNTSHLPWHIYSSLNENIEHILINGIDIDTFNDTIHKFDIYFSTFSSLNLKIKNKKISDSLVSVVDEIKSISKILIKDTVLELNKNIIAFKIENKNQQDQIKEKESNLAILSKLNKEHTDILHKASEFISSQKNINECPLCLSTDFSSAETKLELENSQNNLIKEQLLNIIAKQISGGDKIITDVDKEIKELKILQKKSQEAISQNVNSRFIEQLRIIKSKEEVLSGLINNIIKVYTQRLDGVKNRYNVILSNLRLSINNYKENYKFIFNEEYEISKKEIDQNLIENDEKSLSRLLELLNSEKNEENKVYTLEALSKLKYSFSSVDSNIKLDELSVKISNYSKLIPELDTWNRFYLTPTEKEIVKGIIKYDNDIKRYRDILKNMSTDKEIVSTISSNVSKKKDEILQQLFQNKLIKYIYKEINPHYRFNDITLENKKSGQSNKNYIKYKDVHLNQIFSAAQLNIISLSIFMGMGLPEKTSDFQQLFLDDPIQSMDDLNVLALIDIFRNLADLPDAKSIILSTHDDNFAQLLKIKMRNKKIKVFDFVSYGDEGPVIKSGC